MKKVKQIIKSRKFIIPVALIVVLGLGFFAGDKFAGNDSQNCVGTYQFISPKFNCLQDSTERVTTLQNTLRNYVNRLPSSVARVSIFFRDLNTGRYIGVNEDDKFSPGSILKVVLAIAYYKYSEINPSVLSSQIVYNPSGLGLDFDVMQNIKPKVQLVAGQTYSVQNLLDRMLLYSDNDSMVQLSNAMDQNFLQKVFMDMGVAASSTNEMLLDYITARQVSNVFRSLYGALYLNENGSEKILSTLAQSDFTQGLQAGVASSTKTADKFGERKYTDSNGNLITELHDCGIVYEPQNPYILCVMTQGDSFSDLEPVIEQISKIVYQYQSENSY